MTIELSAERALELLREVVAEHGADYVYHTPDGRRADGETMCQYVHGDKPGCIAGHVLHRAGVDLEDLRYREGNAVNEDAFMELVSNEDVLDMLAGAQQEQDLGGTWGRALAAAEECYAETREA